MLSSLNESDERDFKASSSFLMCNAAFKLNQQSLNCNVREVTLFCPAAV